MDNEHSKEKIFSVIKYLRKAELNGMKDPKIRKNLPRRCFRLAKIVPSNEVLSHIFLGFTKCGRHILSYCLNGDTLHFYIWNFNHHHSLKLVSKHIIHKYNLTSHTNQVEYSFETTEIHVYQWPRDNKHLLILTIPESTQPVMINVIVIHLDQKGSHLVHPGIMPFSVVDWKYKSIQTIRRRGYINEELFSPGILLFGPSVCSFHTGTEIVFLEIQESSNKEEEVCKVISKVLDVEQVLAETLDDENNYKKFAELSNYEVFVLKITRHPSVVYAYVQGIFQGPSGGLSSMEFIIEWNTERGAYEVFECEKPFRSPPSGSKLKAHNFHNISEGLLNSLEVYGVESLNNVQFVESQSSFSKLDSPVDSVRLILS